MLTLFCTILLYFLPAIIGRDRCDATGIFLLNLFLGWTVVGWVIALIWACSAHPYVPVRWAPVSASARYCCQCGSMACAGAHFCTACGHAV
jgi:hypothetical protein